MKLESLLQYLDGYLGVDGHPDYPTALNGLQVAGPDEVQKIAVAVDASEAAIAAAVDLNADLLIVHHGLFWGGLQPLTGRHFRKVQMLLAADIALYSCHLPLDSHGEVGNCAVLGRAMGLELEGQFGPYKGKEIGWWGTLPDATNPIDMSVKLEELLDTVVHLIAGGSDRIERVGIVTGGGASFIEAAVAAGLDALVTGEGSHHSHFDATELGINVFFGGHYATETFGVRALAEHLQERFQVEWHFIDQPTGL
ncbi:MAG: Nif3-like dinuclear metal center hexameric protein [Gemmatimonadetes bacterium]|jgi:dinuclear metal center YbgI/SA1388 family protein|nr:Nif3-like dinuclear metal center hexameric protein [Gemmatimonadota bacterium]